MNIAPDISESLLTTASAARFLGVGAPTLVHWRRRGIGPPFVALGRLIRYRLSDLRAFVADRVRLPGVHQPSPPDPVVGRARRAA